MSTTFEPLSRGKVILLWLLICHVTVKTNGQTPVAINSSSFNISLSTGDSLVVLEDLTNELTFDQVKSEVFFKEFAGSQKPQGTYWLKFSLLNKTDYDLEITNLFDRTSVVELFQLEANQLVLQAKSGGGTPMSEMNKGGDQKQIRLKLKSGTPATIYMRLINGTDYMPDLGVRLIDWDTWVSEREQQYVRDLLLFGAILILIIYALSLLIIHRYKPYLWLALHAFGMLMYSFVGRDYFVHWVVPEFPQLAVATPWALLGLFGLFMLVQSFLETKSKYKKWNLLFSVLRALTIFQIFTSALLMVSYGKFVLSSLITILYFLISVALLMTFVISVWKRLDKSQRVFGFGILFFVGVAALGVVSWLMIDTLGRTTATAMSAIAPVGQILIFAIALGVRMRQHEVDKNIALDKLNTTLVEQKKTIELEVVDRTKEINQQKLELKDRNERIEILFKEVHHRVKNNLQLISSLLNMQQEWSSTEDPAKAIEDSRSRVVAMSMIHQFLYRTDDIATINFKEYAAELVNKLDAIQVQRTPYKLELDFDGEPVFDIDTSISLGLILNELVTNSYKHAVLLKRDLEMSIKLKTLEKGIFSLHFKDNGEAIEKPFEEVIKKGFGLRMASRLAKQLQGKMEYSYEKGNVFTITFADEEARIALSE